MKNKIIGIICVILIIGFIVEQINTNREEKRERQVVTELSQMSGKYYYNQLESGYMKYGKIIYNKLYANKEELKNGKTKLYFDDQFSDMLEENYYEGYQYLYTSYCAAIEVFLTENPEMFFLDPTKMQLNTIKSDKYRVTIDTGDNENYFIDGITSKEDVEKMEKEINNSTYKVMQELKSLNDDYSKIKKVHDYLIDTIEYTDSGEHIRDIYGALVNKKCVCDGYKDTFQYFMNQLNINSICVYGVAHQADTAIPTSINHAWNYVELNNNWYGIDTTWDDPIIQDKKDLTNDVKYEYFLKGAKKMNEEHITKWKLGSDNILLPSADKPLELVAEEFTFPELSETDYE